MDGMGYKLKSIESFMTLGFLGPSHWPRGHGRFSLGSPNLQMIKKLGRGTTQNVPGTCLFLYFGGWTLQSKVASNQNKGHLGSRYPGGIVRRVICFFPVTFLLQVLRTMRFITMKFPPFGNTFFYIFYWLSQASWQSKSKACSLQSCGNHRFGSCVSWMLRVGGFSHWRRLCWTRKYLEDGFPGSFQWLVTLHL